VVLKKRMELSSRFVLLCVALYGVAGLASLADGIIRADRNLPRAWLPCVLGLVWLGGGALWAVRYRSARRKVRTVKRP
jgi:hypothetical protein